MSAHEPIPLILGPTAVGKSRIAYQLALRWGEGTSEIISADARAIYRGMDIGTDKPPPEWRGNVTHHLFDIKEPHESYSAMEFRRDALRILERLARENMRAIVAGGSTLYVDALLGKLFPGPSADPRLRRELRRRRLAELHGELEAVDPAAARRIHPNDRQRIVRALEVYRITGTPISERQRQASGAPYRFAQIGLACRRSRLYERINRRVDEMMERGLLEEARALKGRVPSGSQAYKSSGYQELFRYLEGEIPSLAEAVRLIKRNTRAHARRQLKYFRRDPEIQWIDTADKPVERIVKEVDGLLQC